MQTILELLDRIILPITISDVEFVDKGFSTDRKYKLYSNTQTSFLLRVNDLSTMERQCESFNCLSQLWNLEIPCPEPVCFGVCRELGVSYLVQSYLAGESADEVIPKLSSAQQYKVGLEAGEVLCRIHKALKPSCPVDDYALRSQKYLKHLEIVAELGITYYGQQIADQYVNQYLHLLKDRPTTFRHGDYHPGNLVIDQDQLAGVIDFNRCDWGDPIDDFYKISWFGAPLSPEYACGQIRGYFNGAPPEDFWVLYNLYVALNLPTDIVWTYRNYPRDLDRSIELINQISQTHDFNEGKPPAWWK
jgi:aminoglycoside phosphotransferase (APT) family kinase protein